MTLTNASFSVFGLSVRWYGLLIATGIGLGILLAMKREARFGLPGDTSVDLALAGVPAAIVGARLYYVIFSWDAYAANPVSALYVWEGGLAIYGGILGGLTAGWVYARLHGLSFLTLADLVAPSFALVQAVGRWGNFFNQEAYGTAVIPEALKRFPLAVFIQADGQWHYATFFYESTWCLLIVAFLLWADRRGWFRHPGDTFLTYVLLYACERALVEGLRTDSLYWGPVRVSQALSVLAAVACAATLLYRRGKS